MSIVKQQTALEAERIVLGTLMSGKWDSCQDVVASLTLPETWTGAGHAVIFDAVRRCYGATPQDSVPTLLQSVTDLLSSAGTLKMAGGIEYLEALLESAMNFDDAKDAFFQVQEAAVRRYLATMGRILQKAAADPRRETMDIILEHHRQLREVGCKILAPPIRQPCYKLFDSINMLEKLHNGGYLVRTGYHGLDDELLGFLPGNVCVLAAYPQVDLTAFLTGMLSQSVLPCKTSVPALAVTLRPRLKELVSSLLMRLSSVAMNRVEIYCDLRHEWVYHVVHSASSAGQGGAGGAALCPTIAQPSFSQWLTIFNRDGYIPVAGWLQLEHRQDARAAHPVCQSHLGVSSGIGR